MTASAWFERKSTGRGVTPRDWRGWVAVFVYIAVEVAANLEMPRLVGDTWAKIVCVVASLAFILAVRTLGIGDPLFRVGGDPGARRR